MYETKSLGSDGNQYNLALHDSPPDKTPFFEKFHSLPFATRTAILLTLAISFYSLVSPIPVAPITPAYFLRSTSRSRLALEFVNSLLSPFLITASFIPILLGLVNLRVLYTLDLATPLSGKVKLWLAAFVWVGILSLRVTFAYVFGRAFGWGHPQWMSSQAIHEVGQGESNFRELDVELTLFSSDPQVSLLSFSSSFSSCRCMRGHFNSSLRSPSYAQASFFQQNTEVQANGSDIPP